MASDTTIIDNTSWLSDGDNPSYSIDWGNSISTTTVTGTAGGAWGNVFIAGNGGTGGTGGTGGYGYYTQHTGTTGTFTFTTPSPSTIINHKEICLDDPEADIKIRGTSLMDRLEQIEQRLAILNRNPKLEEEWPQLREAAERYQKLEQELADKQAVWDRLNRPMPKITP